ncbi:hypothetical protein OIU77_007253 [Salix suchowensis]|uniref:Uncharacterized protein n=1 Tax=Salix suchowensis TaxID=1278906 RepID=A0ABQ9AGS5_9ROSI|nr:hypothetical protein OIU77_007253 [Salix suchowensis]
MWRLNCSLECHKCAACNYSRLAMNSLKTNSKLWSPQAGYELDRRHSYLGLPEHCESSFLERLRITFRYPSQKIGALKGGCICKCLIAENVQVQI